MKYYIIGSVVLGVALLISPLIASAGGYGSYGMPNYNYQYRYQYQQPTYYNYSYQPYQNNYQSQYWCSNGYGTYSPCSNYTYYNDGYSNYGYGYPYQYSYPSYDYSYSYPTYYYQPDYSYSYSYTYPGSYY